MAVGEGSIAEELGIEAEDSLVGLNGTATFDVFDYHAAMADPSIEVLIEKATGEQWLLEVEKEEFEDLGLTFDDGLMDEMRTCANNCVFCFIHQNPKGVMRDSIYFCDDDYRMSLMHGSYVTLTNMDADDVNRIITQRMSPINISVHSTDKNRRSYMMDNRRAGKSLKFLKQLADGGITMGFQIVLCKGLNDGDYLDRTIEDLSKLVPHGGGGFSLSVVPAGLTRYRAENGLAHLVPLSTFDCMSLVVQIEEWQERFLKELGTRFVFLADEVYVKAGANLPSYDDYEDFLQLENGVGMLTSFAHEFNRHREEMSPPAVKITVVTGRAAYDFMRNLIPPEMQVDVKMIRNDFYGENVTVAGLLTGQDIIKQLKGKPLGDMLVLPSSCLRHGEEVLLDDVTMADIAKELGVRVSAVNPTGKDFLDFLEGCVI